MLASRAVDRGFEPRSGKTKDYKIGMCCFSANHAALRRKNRDWLTQNQNNVSEWIDMSTYGLLFHWASTIKIQLSLLVWYKANLIIISLKTNLFLLWHSWKILELALNNNHSLTVTKSTSLLWFFKYLLNYLCPLCQSFWIFIPGNLYTYWIVGHLIKIWIICGCCIEKLSP